jgi:NAD(P)-dependent dehydrogenase (short-subunit alcohol dehydrogenase family)
MSRVLITGASRGIGLEFAKQYAEAGWDVIATCRDPARATALAALAAGHPGISVEPLDVTDHAAIDRLAARLAGTPIDLLLNNAGSIGPRDPGHTRIAEQFFGSLNFSEWAKVLAINTLAPVKVAEAFAEHVAASDGRRMVFLSSTTGSNAEGQHAVFAYCSSKAALNKAVTMLAMALKPRGIVCAAVCPGHVRTELGGAGALIDADESVTGLRRVIEGLTPERSGSFTRYDGAPIAW